MKTGEVSIRYARALLAYAEQNGEDEQVCREMCRITDRMRDVPELVHVWGNPLVSVEQKLGLLDKAAGEPSCSHSLSRFFRLLLQSRREDLLGAAAQTYVEMYRDKHHIVSAHIRTACPLEDVVVEHLRHKLEARSQGTVELTCEVDTSLVGGFILDVGRERIDASVATQLRQIEKALDV